LFLEVNSQILSANTRLQLGNQSTNKSVKLDIDPLVDYTVIPSSTQFNIGKTSKRIDSIYTSTADTSKLVVSVGNNIGIMSSLVPGVDSTYNIGDTNKRYANAHLTNITTDNILPSSFVGTKNIGTTTNRFDTVYATMFDGVATNARYADLAERYESDKPYGPGTVVKLGGSKEITETTIACDTDVFGVISTAPAYVMNCCAGNDQTHPVVGLMGRVPVKVVGTVKKHQRLITSEIAGVAMALPDSADITQIPSYCIVGRALKDKVTEEIGLVEATIGIK
jgi:hypothetical protein